MNSNRNILRYQDPALRAHLTRITRVNSYHRLTSFFRFARQPLQQLSPRHVCYTLAISFLLQHALDVQVFYGHEIIPVYQPVCGLVTEIIPPVLDPFMYSGHDSSGLSLGGADFCLWEFIKPSLSLGQGLFFSFEKPLSWNFMAVTDYDKGFQTKVKASNLSSFGQVFGSACIDNDRSIPLPCPRPAHGTIFHSTLGQKPVKDYGDPAYLGQVQSRVRVDMKPRLSVIEGVISELAPKSGIAGIVSAFNSLKERFKGEIHSDHDILKDLAMDCSEFGVLVFPRANETRQLEVRNRDVVIFPSPFSEVYRSVVNKTTDVQGLVESCNV